MFSDRVEAGKIDLSDLARRWALVDQLWETTRRAVYDRSREILTARTIDEGQTAGHRVYIAAERYLAVARGNQQALVSLLLSDHGLSMFAPWTLMRGTFEAAFYTAWLLDPDESLERRRRGLRLEYHDERDHKAYYADVMKLSGHPEFVGEFDALRESLDAADANNAESYRREAQELGLPFPKMPEVKVLDGLSTLSCTGTHKGLDVLLRATWRGLAGQQHGRASAMLRAADKSDVRPTPGGVQAFVSVNDDHFLTAAHVTTTLHLEALGAVLKRTQPGSR